MNLKSTNILKLLFFVFAALITIFSSFKYTGSLIVYIFFSVTFTVLLYLGTNNKSSFFEFFISIFLWLGFWAKLSMRLLNPSFSLSDRTGFFNFSPFSYDEVLTASSCGALGLIFSFILRRKLFSYNTEKMPFKLHGLYRVYEKSYKYLWLSCFIIFALAAFLNLYLGIYQRGASARTTLPFQLNAVFSWLLLFGFSSITSIFLYLEQHRKSASIYGAMLLTLLESFFSNVSMTSRAMITNIFSIGLGLYRQTSTKTLSLGKRFWIISSFLFIVLFVGSVFVSNTARNLFYGKKDFSISLVDTKKLHNSSDLRGLPAEIYSLAINRWVGIDAVMAVSASPEKGWSLMKKAWMEKYQDFGTSFFDLHVIDTPYLKIKNNKNLHFISLPGIVAFLYYPGSYLFLFIAIFSIGVLIGFIERFVFIFSGYNLIITSLMSQVLAYRFSNFGYCPSRSYILFSALIFNVLLIYVLNKLLTKNTDTI